MGLIASISFQCGFVPEGPVAYELISTSNDVVFDASGNPSRTQVSVAAFRLSGTERTAIPVNSQSGAEHYVVLKTVASDGTVSARALFAIGASSLRTMKSVRFDLISKEKTATSYTDADVLASCPVMITHDGTNGTNGSFSSTVFVRAPQKPSAPTGGKYTSPIPTSTVTVGTEQRAWTDAPTSGTDPVWISRALFTPEHTETSPDWSDPVMAVDSNDVEFIWSTKATAPTLPTSHPFDTANPGDWSKDATDAVWMAVSVKTEGAWGEWKMSRIKGEQGPKGDGAVTLSLSPAVVEFKKGKAAPATVYLDISDGGTVARPDSIDSLNATGGGGNGTLATGLTWQWYPNNGGRMYIRLTYTGTSDLYLEKEIVAYYNGTAYRQTLQIRTVADGAPGENGVNGKNGVWVPPPMMWDDYPTSPAYRFQAGNVDGSPADTRLDLVLTRDGSGDLIAWKCLVSHSKGAAGTLAPPSTRTSNTYWQLAEAGTYKFLATDVLWANNAQVNFFSGQAVRVGYRDASGQDVMCGYFGAPTGNAIFYSGGDSPGTATFVVNADGSVRATNADISGRICTSVMDYKVSTAAEGEVPNGSLCYNTSSIKLPALSAGVMRSIRVFNPCSTRATPEDLKLIPENANVRITSIMDFDLAQSQTVIMGGYGARGKCYLELLGINISGGTVWTVNVLNEVS